MNILSIDTVLNKTYIAILLNNKEIFKTLESDENCYHSAYLIKVLSEILNKNNSNLKDFNYIATNTGVGSFTGIRVGLSIAKIISNRLNIKAVPFKTFEVLKSAYSNNNIMLDARRNSVFYSKGEDIELISYEKAREILANNEVFVCDDSLYEKFTDYQKNLISYEQNEKDFPKIELNLVLEKIKKNEITDFVGIKPTYIQTPPIFKAG